MHRLFLFSVGTLLAFNVGCKAPDYTPTELPTSQIAIGSGGGITGMVKEYILLENGQIFLKNSLVDTLSELPTLKRGQARKIYQEMSALSLDTVNFIHPGNTYRYICHRRENSETRITWGDLQHEIHPEIETFYEKLIELIQSN